MTNRAREARLRFIDFLLEHYGELNRAVLEDYWGLSTPQVSRDIQDYIAAAPLNMIYDRSMKIYMRSATFRRVFP